MANSGSVHQGPDESYVASGVIPQYTFVKLHSTKGQVITSATVTDEAVGIAQNAAADGEPVTVRKSGNSLLLIVTTTTAIGSKLAPSTGAAGLVTTTAGDKVAAVAQEVVSAGEYAEVQIVSPGLRYDTF